VGRAGIVSGRAGQRLDALPMLRSIVPATLCLGLLLASCGGSTSGPLPFSWPPAAGEPYPDVELFDHTGETVRLSDFSGKVLLVEAIGMT
jgi:cytochrome oxidase Cu insertion factor (SCO1/SenC/PrrC family)